MTTTNLQSLDQQLADYADSLQTAADAMEMLFPRPRAMPLETFFPSPLSIPPRRAGRLEIARDMVTGSTPIIGARQAVLRGVRPVTLRLRAPLTVHMLRERGRGTWMTDLPEELHQIAEMIAAVKPAGRVLVGGLGLGILVHFLARRPEVEEVVVVERSAQVIKLVEPHLPRGPAKIKVLRGDIYNYAHVATAPHDFFLLDTWQETNETTWWKEVLPLKRAIRRYWRHAVIHCWAEDIMAGQVARALARPGRYWHHANLPSPMTAAEIAYFIGHAGALNWEMRYAPLLPAKCGARE